MFFNKDSLELVNENLFKIHDMTFKGMAILRKDCAAFPNTQLLVARKSDELKLKNLSNNKEVNMEKFSITSDGTVEGTKLSVAGKEIKNLDSLSLYLYPNDYEDTNRLSCNFTVLGKDVDNDFRIDKQYKLSAEGFDEVKEPQKLSDFHIAEAEKFTKLEKQRLSTNRRAKTRGGVSSMDYKGIKFDAESYTPEEIVAKLQAIDSDEEQAQVLAERDSTIVDLQKTVDEQKATIEASATEKAKVAQANKEANAKIEAEKWFDTHKAEYADENKDEIVDIRTKIELETATKDESLKLAELKKSESTLDTGTGESEEDKVKKIDDMFGIKSAYKKQ